MLSVSSPGSLLSELEAELAPDLAEVERILAARVESDLELVKLTSQYLYRGGGKRIRPMLLLIAARAAGGPKGGASPRGPSYGAMVEIMHTATLVHDDIVDEADTRRGQASLNSLLGNDLTVLIGDFLYIQSMSLAVEQENPQVVATMCDLTMRMIEGMLLEKARGGAIGLTREEHLRILRLKTAYLFHGCGKMGAMMVEAPPEVEGALGDYCMNLGMAFQVADDLFDFTASAAMVGKPVLSDLKEGHLTLPILHALEREPEAVPLVEEVLDSGGLTPGQQEEILALVERRGGLDEARRVAEGFAAAARKALEAVPPSSYRDGLEALAEFVIWRER
ncbi:MAG: polyprenyl synthetase family protein [Acidobacteria bacterium]|nr:polyprenyl synthetase family protein [Acidobacteriota bacterium]